MRAPSRENGYGREEKWIGTDGEQSLIMVGGRSENEIQLVIGQSVVMSRQLETVWYNLAKTRWKTSREMRENSYLNDGY